MADVEGTINAKDFGLTTPQETPGFHIKGAGQLEFGMQHRLARIFGADGRTVMLAFDHGYFQGPTSGLERVRSEERRVGKEGRAGRPPEALTQKSTRDKQRKETA